MTSSLSSDKPVRGAKVRTEATRIEGVHIRLRATRRVCQMGSVAEAARKLGVERNRWSNWENDFSLPPPHLLVKLRRLFPWVCLNYIYAGDTNSVMPAVARELQEVEAALRKL